MAKTFEALNACLGKYYKSLGNDTYYQDDGGIGKFLAFCEDNEHDVDDLREELFDEEPDNCAYIDLDDEFPFPQNVEHTNENILNEFKFCYENGCPSTDPKTTKTKQETTDNEPNQVKQSQKSTYNSHKIFKQFEPFNIDKHHSSYAPTKKLYTSESFVTANKNNMDSTDETMLKWLAIGWKNHDLTFLMSLSGACVRDYLFETLVKKKNDDNIDAYVKKWTNKKSALKECLSKHERMELGMAINAYLNRACPAFTGINQILINDSIRDISVYIAMMTQFIHSEIVKKQHFTGASTVPCQIDLIIALKDAKVKEGGVLMPEFDEEEPPVAPSDAPFAAPPVAPPVASPVAPPDDDDDDDLTGYGDEKDDVNAEKGFTLGNLLQKLTHNDLLHNHAPLPNDVLQEVRSLFCNDDDEKKQSVDAVTANMHRCFIPGYIDFRKNIISKKYPKDGASYPRGKRFCVFIDRRNLDEKGQETITFYETTKGTNAFPTEGQYPAEWYLKLPRDCLIPGTTRQEKQAVKDKDGKDTDEKEWVEVPDAKRIGTGTGLEGSIMTFSFHIEQRQEIRCYLHWSGKCFRFYPKDIIDILPLMFDQDSEDNKNWNNSEEAKRIARSIDIRDLRFEKFYQSLDRKAKSPHLIA